MEWQDTKMMLWEITETPEEVMRWHSQNNLYCDEKEILSRKHPLRKLHYLISNWWVSSQLQNPKLLLTYLPNGCPHILGSNEYHVSISHSGSYLGMVLRKKQPIGMDIEWLKRQRPIHQLASYFMNEKELAYFRNDPNSFYRIWCAKEAVYKIYAKVDSEISFQREIEVDLPNRLAYYRRRKTIFSLHPFQWKDEVIGMISFPQTGEMATYFE